MIAISAPINEQRGGRSHVYQHYIDISVVVDIAERGTPQPYATFTTPLRLPGGECPRRRAAIFSADGGMSVAMLRDLIDQGDPRAAAFADPDWELYDLPTGHWALFSAPDALADVLHRVAAA